MRDLDRGTSGPQNAQRQDWSSRLRERLAADGSSRLPIVKPSTRSREHLNDLHRAAERERQDACRSRRRRRSRARANGPARDGGRANVPRAPAADSSRKDGWRAGLAAERRSRAGARCGMNASFSADRRPDAGDRHRRVHRGLQHHQRAAARLAALSQSRAADAGVGDRTRDEPSDPFIVAQPVYEDWKREDAELRVDGHLGVPHLQRRIRSGAGAGAGHSRASASLFTVLGVPPAIGRVFTEDEEARRAEARR